MNANTQSQAQIVSSVTFSDRLLSAMDKIGENKLSLSQKIGVSHTTVGGWIKGAKPSSEYLPAIAAALSVSTQWLLDGTGERDAGAVKNNPSPMPDHPSFRLHEHAPVLKQQDEVISEIQVLVQQFRLLRAPMRKQFIKLINERLFAYDEFCEKNCGDIREALLEEARKRNS